MGDKNRNREQGRKLENSNQCNSNSNTGRC